MQWVLAINLSDSIIIIEAYLSTLFIFLQDSKYRWSVGRVEMSKDLRKATVYWTAFFPENKLEVTFSNSYILLFLHLIFIPSALWLDWKRTEEGSNTEKASI